MADKPRLFGKELIPEAAGGQGAPENEDGTDLEALYRAAERQALAAIDWYHANKKLKSLLSRWLRFLAILLTTLGGLVPILEKHVTIPFLDNPTYGYLYLPLAAACVGLDRFFGLSSGWMRYLTTSMALQKALVEFQMDWTLIWSEVAGGTPTAEQRKALIERVKAFRLLVAGQVEQETQAWVSEFQTNLSQLEKNAREQMAAQQPGGIDLRVANAAKVLDGLEVSLDGRAVTRMRGDRTHIGQVAPGFHAVVVRGRVGERDVETSAVVNVSAGAMAGVSLTLPDATG
jgi:hypothetical protein